MLSGLRAQVDQPGVVYLDHALRGPLPRVALEAGQAALADACRGSLAREAQAASVEATRERLGRLLCWPTAGLAFMQNTTHAIAVFAQSVAWRPGDVVLLHADEVPGNVLPWQALARRGVEIRWLPSRGGRLALPDLERALADRRVRVVSLAAVALPTGERRDLAALGQRVRAAGAWFMVDVAQAAGALVLDLTQVDAIAGSTRKWLLGPPDVGFLGIAPTRLDELHPSQSGAASLADPAGAIASAPEVAWRNDARRLEAGALPGVLFPALAASLELLLADDALTREREVLARSAEVSDRTAASGWQTLSPQDAGRSGVVHLAHPHPPPDLARRLLDEGVVVRGTRQGLRVSAHAWNSSADIDRLASALALLVK